MRCVVPVIPITPDVISVIGHIVSIIPDIVPMHHIIPDVIPKVAYFMGMTLGTT